MRILKLLLALIILTALIYQVGLRDVLTQLSNVTLGSILYLMLIGFVMIYISAIKWKLFLGVFAESISVYRLFAWYLVGYFVNMIVPSYIGGDALRSWQVGKKVGQHQSLAATVLERYTGGVAMLVMALVCMWFLPSITAEIRWIVVLLNAALVVVTVTVLSPGVINTLEKWKLPLKLVKHLRKIQDALNYALSHRRAFMKALLLSFLFHFVALLNVTAAAYAIGWYDVSLFDLAVVLPIILAISVVPITPSGLGIQEGAFYFFLQSIGADPGQATAIGILLRAKVYLLALIGGIVWIFLKKEEGAAPSESEIVSV